MFVQPVNDKVEVDVDDLRLLRAWVAGKMQDGTAMIPGVLDRLIGAIPKRVVITKEALAEMRNPHILQVILDNGGTLPHGWTEEVDG